MKNQITNKQPSRFLKLFNIKCFVIYLSLVLSLYGYSQTPHQDKLDLFFDQLDKNNKAMGSLTLAKNDKVLYTRTIGYSEIKEDKSSPLNSTTKFRVGSVTKMFTAVMIFQLIEEGSLKLADKLDKYVPQIPNSDKISIRDILSHTSGIHDITADPKLRPERTASISKEEMLNIISKAESDFEPGTKFSYSNSGYFVLGYLLEKVTDKSYEENLMERIIEKVGLENSYVASGVTDPDKNESYSYMRFDNWRQVPATHWSILFGSGSLVSTPDDMARFIQALFNHKLVSQESLSHMKTIQKEGYGMGMETFIFGDRIYFGHTGGIDGFGSWLAYQPEEKLAIAYVANAKVYPIKKIIEVVATIYFNQPFEIPTFKTLDLSTDVLDKYVGLYTREGAPVNFTVSRKEKTLFLQMNGKEALPLEAVSNNKFKLASQGMSIEFNEKENQMTFKRGSGARVFTKEN
ncbi:serine hydrolase [Gramella sp. KN1008]|uniref:serine hydrolase domain-containing protein n=1 Tax=Gramella sp. KN1008 TaxID=2529298 RepID=UPI00103B7D46|nr:serine hydrolase domain-containing protein [Gramella sp. KN1008]TBW28289.1 class A beta-lactamase-related serine hydrolase [Gramella sp. KN1008]